MALQMGFIATLLFLSGFHSALSQQCTPVADKPGCVCKLANGGKEIDLTSIANNDGTPRFTGVTEGIYNYDYNPCYSYTLQEKCKDIYGCQEAKDNPQQVVAIADNTTEEIRSDGEKLFVYYEGPEFRVTKVYLICDQSVKEPMLTTSGDTITQLEYLFNLTACHVCPGGCGGGGGQGGTEAGVVGLVLIFVFLFAVVGYFIIGAIVMRQKYEARGVDMIPQKDFWFSVPGLIKDGFLFTISPCVSFVKNKRGYSKM